MTSLAENNPIDILGLWFTPLLLQGYDKSVRGVLSSLNKHPISQDESAQNYIMPEERYLENPSRFRIWGENQDTFCCFVQPKDAAKQNPPVYFETCLDLQLDHGYKRTEIIDGDYVIVSQFNSFLWQMLGHFICFRMEKGGCLAETVNGIVFSEKISLDKSFYCPIRNEFPAGFTCYIGNGAICIPDWGAAFRTLKERDDFVKCFNPSIEMEWA